jgi:hypothetical protein
MDKAAAPTSPMPVPDDVTVCITSCGRRDLLKRTLDSFRRHHSGGRLLISEDSGDAGMLAWLRDNIPDAVVLHDGERRGQMGSVDRLYARVETPYIFHLEDDWAFDGPVDFAAAKAALEKYPDLSIVCVRRYAELKQAHRRSSRGFREGGAVLRVMNPAAHADWYGWTANPGLLKRAFWEKYQPFARYKHDELSALAKGEGRYVAFLLPGVARHIGAGRHATDPFQPRSADANRLKQARKRVKAWLACRR